MFEYSKEQELTYVKSALYDYKRVHSGECTDEFIATAVSGGLCYYFQIHDINLPQLPFLEMEILNTKSRNEKKTGVYSAYIDEPSLLEPRIKLLQRVIRKIKSIKES